jgi:rhodanese-related sulfurtransferase
MFELINRLGKDRQPRLRATPPEVTVTQFVQQHGADETQLLDVREPEEWAEGRAPRAVLIPLGELAGRERELDPERPVVTICRSGRRSLTAADILLAAGFRDVHSLAGGMGAWHDAGLPVER